MKISKRLISTLLISAVISGTCSTTLLAETQNQHVLALDYGQYFGEPGKCSPDGYDEAQYTYNIGKLVKSFIEQDRPYVTIFETNPNGTEKARGDRALKAINNGAELIISLHMDLAPTQGADGKSYNTWQDEVGKNVYGSHTIIDDQSSDRTRTLAKNILDSYLSEANLPMHRPDLQGVQIVDNTVGLLDVAANNGVDAILLEMSFMDHRETAMYFRSTEGQHKIARAIANAIIKNYIDVYIEEPKLEVNDLLSSEELSFLSSVYNDSTKIEPTTEDEVESLPISESLTIETSETTELMEDVEPVVDIETIQDIESIETEYSTPDVDNNIGETPLVQIETNEEPLSDNHESPVKKTENVVTTNNNTSSLKDNEQKKDSPKTTLSSYEQKLLETKALLEKTEKEVQSLESIALGFENITKAAVGDVELSSQLLNDLSSLSNEINNLISQNN